MVKVFMPLYSKQAWGKFYGPYPHGYFYPGYPNSYGYAIYQRYRTWHGVICVKKKYYYPYNPRTLTQQNNRYKIRDGVSIWKSLTDVQKDYYNKRTYPLQMSGYNKFLHYYLIGKPA